MSASMNSMMMAILALFLCLSSTVAAADLFNPGQPLNCTAFAANCRALTQETFGHGKNSSYNGVSTQCNVTNLTAAKPLCGKNVICLATFLVKRSPSDPGSVSTTTTALPSGIETTTTSATNPTTTSAGAPAPTSTLQYTIGFEDLTDKLLAMYDISKCGNAATAMAATSLGALIAVASIVSFMTNML
ncbi:hypothetical protein BGZ51_002136 [Haplosporangium sp. Z 767]|nr:hypothetical protein BGZ51_002136 [Haplosporangium sp. Z 767]KAF9195191.1 hypothetical protein BGZ50_005025 [Haplosporangium sp. Z 11]